jgi:hypothetical protein
MASERDNWLVSTYTGGQGNCVEVSPGLPVLVRDTKGPRRHRLGRNPRRLAQTREGHQGLSMKPVGSL